MYLYNSFNIMFVASKYGRLDNHFLSCQRLIDKLINIQKKYLI